MKKKWWAASLAVAMVITSVPAIPAAVYAAEPMLIEAEDYIIFSLVFCKNAYIYNRRFCS